MYLAGCPEATGDPEAGAAPLWLPAGAGVTVIVPGCGEQLTVTPTRVARATTPDKWLRRILLASAPRASDVILWRKVTLLVDTIPGRLDPLSNRSGWLGAMLDRRPALTTAQCHHVRNTG